jgi:hypothetical protein
LLGLRAGFGPAADERLADAVARQFPDAGAAGIQVGADIGVDQVWLTGGDWMHSGRCRTYSSSRRRPGPTVQSSERRKSWIPACAGMTGRRPSVTASQATFLIEQFLHRVADRPRSQVEARAVWGSTCPLNCAWEDAPCDDLVALTRDGSIMLTAVGRTRLGERA